jgi:hypothetical protein
MLDTDGRALIEPKEGVQSMADTVLSIIGPKGVYRLDDR